MIRNILIVIVALLWLALGWKMCTDQGECCGDEADENTEVISSAAATSAAPIAAAAQLPDCTTGIICIADDSYQAAYGTGFDSYIDSIKSSLGDGQKLKITGLYTSTEQAGYKGGMENLGIHRADVIRQKISSKFSPGQVELVGQQVVGRNLGPGDKINFGIIEAAAPNAPKVESSTAIYFPYNSTDKLSDGEINSYLTQVATRVKASGEGVRLEGHTDSAGPADGNQKLGLSRATVIKQNLVSKGVAASKISVSSKGETTPVATNATAEGRALNRRTELTIIK